MRSCSLVLYPLRPKGIDDGREHDEADPYNFVALKGFIKKADLPNKGK